MKLLGLIINNQTIGIERDSWYEYELNGNAPLLVIEDTDSIPDGYNDISSFNNWIKYSKYLNASFVSIRNELRKFFPSDLSTLTSQQIEVLENYCLYKYFKIYDRIGDGNIIQNDSPPIDVDYDIMGYAKKRTFNQGELVKVEYFENFIPSSNTYSVKVVEEDRIYYRINQMLNSRAMVIKWFLNDGSIGYTKTTNKSYTTLEAIQAGETRRANVISDLKINVIGLIMSMQQGVTSIQAQMTGAPFLNTYALQISKYIQGFEQDIKDAIQNDTTFTWLNLVIPNTGGMTVRQYLIAGLTIDYTVNNTNI
jgi:hypothetical protein